MRIEPTLTRQTERASAQIGRCQPGKSFLQLRGLQQGHVNAEAALHAVVCLQAIAPGRRGQEQVAPFMKPHLGRLAIHRQVVTNVLDELGAELRHANIFRRGKLVADGRC